MLNHFEEARDDQKRYQGLAEQNSTHEEGIEDTDKALDASNVEAIETGNVAGTEEGDDGVADKLQGSKNISVVDDSSLPFLVEGNMVKRSENS